MGNKAPVQNMERHFVVRIEEAFSLKAGKDGIEGIKYAVKSVSPELFYFYGERNNLVCLQ